MKDKPDQPDDQMPTPPTPISRSPFLSRQQTVRMRPLKKHGADSKSETLHNVAELTGKQHSMSVPVTPITPDVSGKS